MFGRDNAVTDLIKELRRQDKSVVDSLIDILAFDDESQRRVNQQLVNDNNDFKSPTQNINAQDLKRQQEQSLRVMTKTAVFSPAVFLATRDLQDRFQYERIPALQAASKSGGEYSNAIGSALIKRENYVRNVTSQLTSSIQSTVLLGGFALQAYRNAPSAYRNTRRLAKFSRSVNSLSKFIRGMRMARRISRGLTTAAATATAGSGGAALPALAAAAAVEAITILFMNRVIEPIVRFALKNKLNNLMASDIASKVLDAQKSISYYEQVRGIPNFSLNELSNLREQTLMYGVPLEGVLGSLRLVEFGTPTVPSRSNYATQISNLAGFFGMDPNSVGQIFSNLAPIGASAGTSRRLQPVINEFETFFIAVSQSVNPSLSQIELVKQLAQFSRNYVYGRKMVADLGTLTQIQDFISRTVIGDKQSIAPTQSVIENLDNMLMGFVNSSNPNATIFAQQAGISRSDAVRGVTSDPKVLNSILDTLQKTYNISSNSSSEDESRLLFYLQDRLNLSPEVALNLLRLTEAYASGDSVSPVQTENLNLDMTAQPESLPPVNNDGVITLTERRYLDTTVKALEILSASEQNTFRLLEDNLENLPSIIQISRKTTEMFVNQLARDVGTYVRLFKEFVDNLPKNYPDLFVPGSNTNSSSPNTSNASPSSTSNDFFAASQSRQNNFVFPEKNYVSANVNTSFENNDNTDFNNAFESTDVTYVLDLQYTDANALEFAQKFVDRYNETYGNNV